MPKNEKEKIIRNVSGERIAYFRKNLKQKTSQQRLAKLLQLSGLNVEKNTVQEWEAGTRSIKDTQIKIIAEVLGVTPNDLILPTDSTED